LTATRVSNEHLHLTTMNLQNHSFVVGKHIHIMGH